MKNNSLDDIVKCNIEISNPVSNGATFNSILIVVPEPEASGEKEIAGVISISDAKELLSYGFTENDTAYIATEVAFSQSPAPEQIYLIVRVKDGEVYESIKATLNKALSYSDFYGIHITDFRDDEDVSAAVEWAEANQKIFGFEYTDIDSCPVKNFSYYRSFGIFSGKADGYPVEEQPKVNEYAALAWMAKCFGYDPGTETWHLKELASIVPSALSSSDKQQLGETMINTFLRYAGSNITFGGYMLSGEWIDVIRFRDWLKSEMQTRVFNALKVNRKVPFTDAGIGMIEGAMEAVLRRGQALGGIAPTQFDENENEIPGYTVTVPRSSDLTEAERKSRKLTGCRYTARLAGAIHAVTIEGFLTF